MVALARGLKQQTKPVFKKAMEEGRLLFVTPFKADITRVTSTTALTRNPLMIEIADEITVGYASNGG